MKLTLYAVLLGLILSIAPSLYAQTGSHESEYYYVSTQIEKLFIHKDGYMVTYRKAVNQIGRLFIPIEWFSDPNGGADVKADMIFMRPGTTWPYLTIYYKSGEFSHIRLHVRRERAHETWAVAPFNIDLSDYFRGVEEIHLEY